MKTLFTAALIFASSSLFCDNPSTGQVGTSFRLMPVPRTPEPNNTLLAIAIPKDGTVLKGNPVWVQFRIDGYSLGSDSQFDRGDEVVGTDMGQTIHFVIDNHSYIPVNEPAIDPFSEDGYYYDTSYKFELPLTLKEGTHTIRAFPARSFGESLKGERAFEAKVFHIGRKSDNPDIDLSAPYLTYNEPSDNLYLVEGKPILFDFYISNCELSPDGYKVRLTLNGKASRTVTSWQPHYLYGLKKGKHTIRLELLDASNQLVPGFFNSVQKTITVH